MQTSHGCSPASKSAAVISRSPLEPSCRSTATRGLESEGALSSVSGVAAGTKLRFHAGASRVESEACSWATQAGLVCSFSSSKLVASHTSRSVASGASTTGAVSPATVTRTCRAAVVRPSVMHGTSAAASWAVTAAAWSAATSNISPGSSANAAASRPAALPPPSAAVAAGSSTSRPRLPAKAISSSATRGPPSLTSCPLSTEREQRSDCTAAKARPSSAGSSRSGQVSPIWV
mmetsp:Transcript_10741/g.25284  ORF Transcript_10741/g.25284 Transcript_10741/m.25284 type:complete len:233 (+) Transcript_10741:905-1603(+)